MNIQSLNKYKMKSSYQTIIEMVIDILRDLIINYKDIIRDSINYNNRVRESIENQYDIEKNGNEYDDNTATDFTIIGQECNDPIDIFVNNPNELTVTNLIRYLRNKGLSKNEIINLINQNLDAYNNQILNDDCGCACYCGGGNCSKESCIEYTCIDTSGCGNCASSTCIC